MSWDWTSFAIGCFIGMVVTAVVLVNLLCSGAEDDDEW